MKCSRCGAELPLEGLVPAFDAFTGQPVCDGCTRAQRHTLRGKLALRELSK